MSESTTLPVSKSGIRWLWISVLVIAVDQLSKMWIERDFALGDRINLLPVLDITRAHNTGAAFSFLADAGGWQRWGFSVLALGVSVALVVWLRRLALSTHALLICGLTLILGGALGNVIDRIEHGYVVDFILAYWRGAYFPAFNIADTAITLGAVLMFSDALREWRRERAQAAQERQG